MGAMYAPLALRLANILYPLRWYTYIRSFSIPNLSIQATVPVAQSSYGGPNKTNVIVGAVIGAIGGLCFGVMVILWWHRASRRRQERRSAEWAQIVPNPFPADRGPHQSEGKIRTGGIHLHP